MKALLDPRLIGAIAVNFIPLAGIFLFGWNAFDLMLLYWLENVIVGGLAVAKMLLGGILRGTGHFVVSATMSAFFTAHYGLFCFVHGIFVWTLFGDGAQQSMNFFSPFDMARGVLSHANAEPGFWWGALGLVAAYGGMLLFWLFSRGWRETGMVAEFTRPYVRIILLHVTIIVVAMPVMLLGSPTIGVVFLALLKSWLDISFALKHRFPLAEAMEGEDPNGIFAGLKKE